MSKYGYMPTYITSRPKKTKRKPTHEEIEKQILEFEQSGGRIEKLPGYRDSPGRRVGSTFDFH
jgi:hypothetical protein